jgi:rod shape determining protein RodA
MSSKIFDRFNFRILVAVLGLMTIGLLAIYSATNGNDIVSDNFKKQVIGAIGGLIIMITIYYLPPRYLQLASYPFYIFTLFLLVLVLFIGKRVLGHTSWFSIGGFGIQPSEFAKIATVVTLARFLSDKQFDTDVTKPRDFMIAIFIGLFPVALIMLQPDTGTSLVFFAVLLPILYWGGMSNFVLFVLVTPLILAVFSFLGTYYFIVSLIVSVIILLLFKKNILISTLVIIMFIVSGTSVNLVYNKLQPYQQKRIVAVFNPESDALGSGYNIIQSKIAIGSGGMWGKGFLLGTQTQLKYIPEQWTDFIFCMVGEEFGFAGSIVVVVLFFILVLQAISTAYLCKNRFLSLCTIGFASIFLYHFFFNIGMTCGIMPVIGIPLPFMSYGISFLISNFIMIGIFLNAYRNRKEYT